MFSFSILTTAFVMSPLLKVSLEKCRFRLAVYILIFGSRLGITAMKTTTQNNLFNKKCS